MSNHPVEEAFVSHIKADTGTPATPGALSLETLCPKFSNPLFVMRTNNLGKRDGILPRLSYFTNEDAFRQDKRSCKLIVFIQDNDQDRMEQVKKRLIERMTGPYKPRPLEPRLVSENARIGQIRLIADEGGSDASKLHMRRLVFDVMYVCKENS